MGVFLLVSPYLVPYAISIQRNDMASDDLAILGAIWHHLDPASKTVLFTGK